MTRTAATDLVTLLEALAERHEDPAVRVVLVTRSAAGLRAALTGSSKSGMAGSPRVRRSWIWGPKAARTTRSAGSARPSPRSPPR